MPDHSWRTSVGFLTLLSHQYLCPGAEPRQGAQMRELLEAMKPQNDQFNTISRSANSDSGCARFAGSWHCLVLLQCILLGLCTELLETSVDPIFQSLICGEACAATASGTCWGNFSTFIKGGQYMFFP